MPKLTIVLLVIISSLATPAITKREYTILIILVVGSVLVPIVVACILLVSLYSFEIMPYNIALLWFITAIKFNFISINNF